MVAPSTSYRPRALLQILKEGFLPLFFCGTLLSGSAASAQHVDFNARMEKALQDIVHLRYGALHQKLRQERKKHPQNRAADYLEAASICIALFVNERVEGFTQEEPRLETLLERLETVPEKDPYQKLLRGEIMLGTAILQGKYGHTWAAAWRFSKAYKLLKTNYERFPEFAPNYLPWGVLMTAIGSLPESYQVIAGLLGFAGDVDSGLALIRQGYYQCQNTARWRFYKGYHGFVYAFVYQQLEIKPAPTLPQLGLPVASSSFFIYLHAQELLDQGKATKAYILLQKRPQGEGLLPFPFLHYLTGKVALSVAPEKAGPHFHRFLRESENDIYRNSSQRFLAWYHLLRREKDSVAYWRERLLQAPPGASGADEQARREARLGWNPTLVRARLAYDGGRYHEALHLLKNDPPAHLANWARLEWHYRQGRAYQALHAYQKAQKHYQRGLRSPPTENSYALGNSTLQLGNLALKAQDTSTARQWYQRCLNYTDYPFYEGIHQKAKARLSGL